MPDRSTCRSATPNNSPEPASTPRWDPSATRSINALAESIIGLYKTELVDNRGPWQSAEDLELETLLWVEWWNHRRLMGTATPTEREEAYYRHHTPTDTHSEAMTLKT